MLVSQLAPVFLSVTTTHTDVSPLRSEETNERRSAFIKAEGLNDDRSLAFNRTLLRDFCIH